MKKNILIKMSADADPTHTKRIEQEITLFFKLEQFKRAALQSTMLLCATFAISVTPQKQKMNHYYI